MSRIQPPPEPFADLTDLSLDATGTFVMYATDEFFAPKESLVKPGPPEWREGAYTERGKWMDGWESRRRRDAGHDFVILRLGTPGAIAGALVDTTHFKGNAPQAVALEIAARPHTAETEALLALPVAADLAAWRAAAGAAWLEVLPRTEIRPDTPNALMLPTPTSRTTHVRLRIHPDGGVARLRLYGTVVPEPSAFWGAASIDLAAIEHGGAIVEASDRFFGPPSNLLLPGRGSDMGDGWETARRRTPGTDWCVIRLGRRGRIERIECDTCLFKGNAPRAVSVESIDAEGLDAAAVAARLASPEGWQTLIEPTPLVPHRLHVLEPEGRTMATHLKVHMHPHGGINRLRAIGRACPTPGERAALAALSALAEPAYRELLHAWCGSAAFVKALAGARPFGSVRALLEAVAAAQAALGEADLLEAFAAHPAIGASAPAERQTAVSAQWSRAEQAGVAGAGEELRARLAEANRKYAERFGFVCIVDAAGRGAAELLEALERRLAHDRATEIAIAARQQSRITRRRVEAWLLAHGADAVSP